MIFVTVGAQMPFDRLVRTVDSWAGRGARGDVLAQIGTTDYRPQHVKWVGFLEPPALRRTISEADAVVGHAGMGTILTALQLGKPILVMPRRGVLRETRNDHQVATAQRWQQLGRVAVAWDDTALQYKLDRLEQLVASRPIGPDASAELMATVGQFIDASA